MTKREIMRALRGALYAVALIGLYWLTIALAGSAGLF